LREKQGFSQRLSRVMIQGAMGKSWHLMACILVIAGTAIATITSRLFSALAPQKSIFRPLHDKAFPSKPGIN
jgi:hypothetical protein